MANRPASGPVRAGPIGDIGTHAYNLAAFVTGLEPASLLADPRLVRTGAAAGRQRLDPPALDGNGGKGHLWMSQVAAGNENHLTLRIYGSKGGLEWEQENPNRLWFTRFGEAKRLLSRNGAEARPEAIRSSRIPAGHPEGFLEAFANIYQEAAVAIRAARNGEKVSSALYPTVHDGVRGLRFIEACVASNAADARWTAIGTP